MRSLQARLSTSLGLALVVLIALVVVVGGYSLRHLLESFVAARLEHDLDALLAALVFDDDGRPVLDEERLDPIFRRPYSGHYYLLRSADTVLRSRSLWDADLAVPPARTDAVTRCRVPGPRDQQLLLLARTFNVQGHSVTIAVTEDFTPLAAGLRQLLLYWVLIAVAVSMAFALLQRLLVRRSLRPLDEIRRDVLRLARGEIERLHATAPVEIRPLVQEINRLIEVMGQRLSRSRHALGNLAHALKTPLTVLSRLGDRAGLPEALKTELQTEVRQLRLLMERELKRARIAGAALPGQRVVLADELADLVETLQKIYRDKPLQIERRIAPQSLFPGDRDDLMELLGNLLDNACKWAASRVRLTAVEAEGRVRISVEDDGPGCSAEQLKELSRRGARVDESRAGHGLGLAIAADVVEQYGGCLQLGRSPSLGGFLAEVELPVHGAV